MMRQKNKKTPNAIYLCHDQIWSNTLTKKKDSEYNDETTKKIIPETPTMISSVGGVRSGRGSGVEELVR